MSHSTAAIFVMLNNFFHDFAVALLFASLLVLSVVYRKARDPGSSHWRAVAAELADIFNKVIYACWGAIILGGIVRTLAYQDFEWNEAAGRGQIPALVVKHVILVGLVAYGTYIQIRLAKRLKEFRA
jgi:hypothetical protein